MPCCVSDWQILDRESMLEFAAGLEEAAVDLNAKGLTFSCHNHNMEFGKFDGEYILDLIYANAPHMKAEIDTCWVQMGGCDPAEWITKYTGRQILFHLKRFRPLPFTATTAPVGTGNLKWQEIIPAAEKAGGGMVHRRTGHLFQRSVRIAEGQFRLSGPEFCPLKKRSCA